MKKGNNSKSTDVKSYGSCTLHFLSLASNYILNFIEIISIVFDLKFGQRHDGFSQNNVKSTEARVMVLVKSSDARFIVLVHCTSSHCPLNIFQVSLKSL